MKAGQKIVLTDEQQRIIRELNDPMYTVEYIETYININDQKNTFFPIAETCKGYFSAVEAIEKLNTRTQCYYTIDTSKGLKAYICPSEKCEFKRDSKGVYNGNL